MRLVADICQRYALFVWGRRSGKTTAKKEVFYMDRCSGGCMDGRDYIALRRDSRAGDNGNCISTFICRPGEALDKLA